jgi:hypothetical protein
MGLSSSLLHSSLHRPLALTDLYGYFLQKTLQEPVGVACAASKRVLTLLCTGVKALRHAACSQFHWLVLSLASAKAEIREISQVS